MPHPPRLPRFADHLIEPLENRVAPAIVTGSLNLSSLDSKHGFKITGAAAGDYAGERISAAGDINGDGIADFIVAAPVAEGTAGAAYVIFGRRGEPVNPAVSLAAIAAGNGSSGFKIVGAATGDYAGDSVSAAGDVNGDGIADLIIGADGADGGAGAAYVVFGHTGSFSAVLNLSSLNGSNGFKIAGETAGDTVGISVGAAGDVNGDGIADMIVGAQFASPNGATNSGAAYVIFGHSTAFPAVLNLSSLDGSNGFKMAGEATHDEVGVAVSGAGDMNGDGFADLIVGALHADTNSLQNTGAAYVVFGHAGAFPAVLNLSSLDGTNGFKITGETANGNLGVRLSNAGDVNGDGLSDIIVGATSSSSVSSAAYVIFGQHSFTSTPTPGFSLAVSTLDGHNGFKISTGTDGATVSGGGDVNGDGFSDLIVGSAYANDKAGASYVVFGHSGAFGSTLDPTSLTGANGFKINGETSGDYSGSAVSLVDDVNGDGYADLLIGAGDAAGTAGAAYIVYGGPSGSGVTHGVVTGKTAHFTDVDGDLVTVTISKGILPDTLDILQKSDSTSNGQLLDIDLTAAQAGSNISVTVKRGPGGDGKVNVGLIDATGFDLGKVTVQGDLGKIIAGDPGGTGLAVKSLTVESLGNFDGLTEDTGSDHISLITGAVGPIKIAGDVKNAELEVLNTNAAGTGTLASLFIGGSLRGGSTSHSGEIAAAAAMGSVHIGGDLVGGTADHSGYLFGTSIGSLTIGGSLLGGTGNASGGVDSGHGSIGNVTIHGDFVGGDNADSGQIVAQAGGSIGKVIIGGSQIGGSGARSGRIVSGSGNIASVTIGGDARAGEGPFAGGLAAGLLGPVVIKGSVIGTEENPYTITGAGAISGSKSLAIASIKVGGNFEDALVRAGFSPISTEIPVNGHAQIGAITVGRDWISSSVTAGAVDAEGGVTRLGAGGEQLINAGASTAISSIASIVIKGGAMGTFTPGDFFGIVAEQIGAATIAGVKLKLNSGPANDTTGIAIGFTPDFILREIGAA